MCEILSFSCLYMGLIVLQINKNTFLFNTFPKFENFRDPRGYSTFSVSILSVNTPYRKFRENFIYPTKCTKECPNLPNFQYLLTILFSVLTIFPSVTLSDSIFGSTWYYLCQYIPLGISNECY